VAGEPSFRPGVRGRTELAFGELKAAGPVCPDAAQLLMRECFRAPARTGSCTTRGKEHLLSSPPTVQTRAAPQSPPAPAATAAVARLGCCEGLSAVS
jgi:hypothetical protein